MDGVTKAKAAVSEFLHNAGHKETIVSEEIAPAVVQETIRKTRHEEVQTAVDREIHQDHYHVTVQPVKAVEVASERHEAVVAPVQERHIDQGAKVLPKIQQELERERAQFHDQHTVVEGQHTQSQGATLVGEHTHYHVHEVIQPILQKEVIQPSVVHTTVPVHEVIRAEPKIHATSALPAVSLSEFERQGGTLSGRGERIDTFEGAPKPVSAALGGSPVTGVSSATSTSSRGLTGSHSATTPHSSTHSPLSSTSGTHRGTDGQIGTQPKTPHSSSLLNKLDPRVDSNGDGVAGFGK